MATSTLIKSAVMGFALTASSSLWAVECSEVVWDSSVLSQYPNIGDLCQSVTVKDGKYYVEVQGKFIRMHHGKARIKFKHSDGSYGKTFESKTLPDDYAVMINGESVPAQRIQRDTMLTVYIPSDRFMLLSDLSSATAYDMVEVEEDPVMPKTASWTPLLGLLGALGCGLGLLMTSLRRIRRRA